MQKNQSKSQTYHAFCSRRKLGDFKKPFEDYKKSGQQGEYMELASFYAGYEVVMHFFTLFRGNLHVVGMLGKVLPERY